ncbi:MAG: CDP-glycerol glycerophosphotransferase family protein [Coriobacteriia bacterium]|nr:CDP-glycerol glycerophosphotransferase family protein [Coriobacteriia bacterium]
MLEFSIKIFCLLARIIYFFMKLLPTRNKITFISRQSNEPTLDITLLEGELKSNLPDYEFVTKCRILTEGVGATLGYLPSMISQMHHIATSKLVILDSYCIPISILKHKHNLKVLQMWHAMGLMKKAGYAALGSVEGRDRELASLLHMHRGYTHILASSPECKEAMLEVFGYANADSSGNEKTLQEVIIGALPRVDRLIDEAIRAETSARIYETYPYLKGRKVVLYAPTSRKDNAELNARIQQLADAIQALNGQDGNYILLVKLHPLQDGSLAHKCESHVLFDQVFSTVDVGMIADACVSDYSSLIYEFMIMEKPTYFFAFDLDEYEQARGLFIDYQKEIPGEIHKDTKGLAQALSHDESLQKEQRAFLTKYVAYCKDSNAGKLAKDIMRIIND